MTDRPRVRRPRLERTNAIRNWATLFGMPMGGTSGARGGATENGENGHRDSRPNGTVEDVVARSVGLGYRVIDEYIQQGERVARSLGDRSYGTTTMLNDTQAVASRMAQYATEMTSLWFEMAGLAARGGAFPLGAMMSPGRAASGATEPSAAASAGTQATMPATCLRVAVQSSRPTQVTVDVRLAGAVEPLVASALRATAPGAPRIGDLTVERAEGNLPVTVRIRVPDDQAPGDYEGTLVDDTGRSVGWITLRVDAP